MPEGRADFLGDKGNSLFLGAEFEEYVGQYVCLENYSSRKIITSSCDPTLALHDARARGFLEPVIVYIPRKGQVSAYKIGGRNGS